MTGSSGTPTFNQVGDEVVNSHFNALFGFEFL